MLTDDHHISIAHDVDGIEKHRQIMPPNQPRHGTEVVRNGLVVKSGLLTKYNCVPENAK